MLFHDMRADFRLLFRVSRHQARARIGRTAYFMRSRMPPRVSHRIKRENKMPNDYIA